MAESGEFVGDSLNVLFDAPRPSIAVVAAGGVALAYEGRVIDLVGLTNSEMVHSSRDRSGPKGHAGFNSETFFKQQPELVVPIGQYRNSVTNDWQGNYDWLNAVMKGVLDTESFKERYQVALLKSPDANTQLLVFVERGLLDTLADRGIEVELRLDSTSVDE
jgi:hypothetical protein